MNPEFDAIDGTILAERTLKRSARSGPRVGDLVLALFHANGATRYFKRGQCAVVAPPYLATRSRQQGNNVRAPSKETIRCAT